MGEPESYGMIRQSPQFELPVAIAVVAAITVWCTTLLMPKPAAIVLPSVELDICEAVFRYQFRHNASTEQLKAGEYYLTIQSKNPSRDFISRFDDHSPRVQDGSGFREGCGCLKFYIAEIKRLSEDRAMVSGGYYAGPLGATGNSYMVVCVNGKWVVESMKGKWIS